MTKLMDIVVSVVFGAWAVFIGGLVSYSAGRVALCFIPNDGFTRQWFVTIVIGATFLTIAVCVVGVLCVLGDEIRKQINKITDKRALT
jgi:hypothetical protein